MIIKWENKKELKHQIQEISKSNFVGWSRQFLISLNESYAIDKEISTIVGEIEHYLTQGICTQL